MRKSIAILLLFAGSLQAQDISITKGWKFKTGDQPEWSSPVFNDANWTPIEVGKTWENQGFDHYDGFAWYRLHVVIPSSIKEKSFLKEKLVFDLGKIDDGDEVYLNGSLIGRNADKGADIKNGPYDVQRSYSISLKDPRILWDKENIVAVRVWDHGGDGGMYGGIYGIGVLDLINYAAFDAQSNDFTFPAPHKISKKIILRSTNEKYDFTGKLRILIFDPVSAQTVFTQTVGVDFAKGRPFEYVYTAAVPENKSYEASYIFTEDRTSKEIHVREGLPFILTPPAGPKPKINGSSLYGVRPGSPFLFKIAATGQKPLSYAVANLPPGLVLDKSTGIISGQIKVRGDYRTTITVSNKLGSASRSFLIRCGDLIGLTPTLGWNSWNCWGLSVSDEKVRRSTKAMFDQLADHGWSYINIDDGWQDKRDDQGNMLPNDKFPNIKALADYIHSLGFKIGIYSSPGPKTCGGFAGSYQHEMQDIQTYSQWGIDYLKYDWCSYGEIAPSKPTLEEYKKPYELMQSCIQKSNRDILFSLCQYGMGDVWKWGAQVGGNSWRTTGDITDDWASLSGIGFRQYESAPYTQPGHFNDPDMLIVGKVGWGPSLHPSRISPEEQYTHISLWCMLSSPLLIGCDMSQFDAFTLNLLTNDEVIAIDQDALAKPAKKVFDKNQVQVWTKELEGGKTAIGIFNLSDSLVKPSIDFGAIQISPHQKLRDAWRQKELGSFSNSFAGAVAAHGVLLLVAKPVDGKK